MIPRLAVPDPGEQRRLLGAFLRTHREKVAADAAAPDARRRRTPGLRREEVALGCGISPTWYAWLEQGRDISPSPQVLARLAETLRLTRAERAYLFALARRRDPADPELGSAPLSPALATAIEAMPFPAYLLDRLWRPRAWNRAAARLFVGWLDASAARPEPSSLLHYVFLEPAVRRLIINWQERAHRLLAEFRADTGRLPGDPAMQELVSTLQQQSPDFARLWQAHDVLAREGGERRFDHPADGPLLFEQATLMPAELPDHKLVLLTPKREAA